MINKIDGKPAHAEHRINTIGSPHSVTLRCSCGWWHRETRHQNAYARTAKARAAVAEHERTIAPALIVDWMA